MYRILLLITCMIAIPYEQFAQRVIDKIRGNRAAPIPGVAAIVKPPVQIAWSVTDRFESSWAAWSIQTNTYDRSFVEPDRWEINLIGCGSIIPKDPIIQYAWNIEGIDKPAYRFNYSTDKCSSVIPDRDIQPGRFMVTLTIKTKSCVQKSDKKEINASDYLVVSIGDSFSSGEGNPDVEGEYTATTDLWRACRNQTIWSTQKHAQWADKRCHRSKKGAPAVAARSLEESSPQTSVTFLSFACSGARVEHLITKRYEGQHPVEGESVPPQVDAVRTAVGSRTIDLLTISVGINDLNFSGFVKSCANPLGYFSNCDPMVLYKNIDSLDMKYKKLAADIKRNLKVKEIMIVQYPVEVFSGRNMSDRVCECLSLGKDFMEAGVNDAEASTLSSGGSMLNKKVKDAALANGWTYIYGVVDEFRGHGYCVSESGRYFRRRVESMKIQGRRDGAMHPNVNGHKVVGNLMHRAMGFSASTRPARKVTITFNKILSGWPGPTPANERANVSIQVVQYPKKPFNDYYMEWPVLRDASFQMEVKKGEWTALSGRHYTYEFDLFNPPQPLNVITDFDIIIVINGISLSKLNKPANTRGKHTMLSPSNVKVKRAGIDYTIDIKEYPKFGPADPNQPTLPVNTIR